MSSKGKLLNNLEIWEKRAGNLVAINSHTDLFSSVTYLCLQQKSMSVNALSRPLEAVAKSIKHAAAIASSKLLLDHSSHEFSII